MGDDGSDGLMDLGNYKSRRQAGRGLGTTYLGISDDSAAWPSSPGPDPGVGQLAHPTRPIPAPS